MFEIKMPKGKKMVLIVIALIIIMIFGAKAISERSQEKGVQTAAANAVTVEVQKAKLTDSLSGLTYKAELKPTEEATVSSNVSGKVTTVLFNDGDQVTQGQALVCLDDKDAQIKLRTATLDLNKLQIDFSAKQKRFNTAKVLYENGACSKTDLDDAETAYKAVQADIELKKVEIQNIQNLINDSVIKAAINGGIINKSASVGQYVNPGSTLATIKNNASITAVIKLRQEDLGKVAVGQSVNLKLSQNNKNAFSGVVETISKSADIQTRVFDCLVKIDNPNGALNSGVTGYIEIPDKDKKQVLAVPMIAVVGTEGNYSVLVVKENKAQKVSVTIGKMSENMVEITSGLKEGDTVIVTNTNTLLDGDKIVVSGEVK